MLSAIAASQLAIAPTPHAHFGIGAIGRLPGVLRDAGGDAVLVVTDAALATTPVIASVTGALEAAGIPVTVFSGVHPNPTTGDLAAGADAAAAVGPGLVRGASGPPRIALVAVGGGSPIDAAKGIALAAVNPQRGRDLDYRNQFAVKALPIVAVPTTAGTGAETNAFGVVTDPVTHRKFYVGHASSLPAAAILDPGLTVGLPPLATAATGMDALTHALESYLSVRANPWSDGIALQVIRMIAAYLPRACADGMDLEARIADAAGRAHGRHRDGDHRARPVPRGRPLARRPVRHRARRRADHAAARTCSGSTPRSAATAWTTWRSRSALSDTGGRSNAEAAIEAIAGLADQIGMTQRMADLGITGPDFGQIAADALDDEVLANTPRRPPPTTSRRSCWRPASYPAAEGPGR